MFSPLLVEAHNPGPMTGRGNNTYLVIGAGGAATLIDAGVGDAAHLADLDRQVSAHRATLDQVLVTHWHRDHASGARALAAAYPGARFAKFPWPAEDGRYGVDWRAIADNDRVSIGGDALTAVHTPGHSPDHVAFWHQPSRTVFSGDLVAAGSSVMIHWSRGGNLADYLTSLERLLALDPARLLPAHGDEPADPRALLVQVLEHRRMRERQIVAALDRGCASVQAIAHSIYDGLDPALVAAACENVRAHLEKLKAEGLAQDDNGRWTHTDG